MKPSRDDEKSLATNSLKNQPTPGRRGFLKTTVGVAAATAAFAPRFEILAGSTKGANERVGIGFIGAGGRAAAHIDIINQFNDRGVAQAVAVCDVYRPRLEAASRKTGSTKMYMEHEQLLDDKNVDVVCIASPRSPACPAGDRRHESRKRCLL